MVSLLVRFVTFVMFLMVGIDKRTFYEKLRKYKIYIIAGHSHKNRSVFLIKCIEEKIITKCSMK